MTISTAADLSPSKTVAVVGGGVVGMACALTLKRRGHDVVVYDPEKPGSRTSFGNAALFANNAVLPYGVPGVLWQVPGMMLDPLGPLAIKPAYLPKILPWLVRFALATRPAAFNKIASEMRPLVAPSLDYWLELLGPEGSARFVERTGALYVYESPEKLAAARQEAALRRQFGVRIDDVAAEEIRQLEPALKPGLAGGMLFPDSGNTINPQALTTHLVAEFTRLGGRIVPQAVEGFVFGPLGPCAVKIATGAEPCGFVVLSGGAWSKGLAEELGASVPLDTERGYHMMLPTPGLKLNRPVAAGDAKFIMTSLETGLRLAGTVEFGGVKAPPTPGRAEKLLVHARRLLPELNEADAKPWMGFRPSMPDSKPVIGRSPRHRNAILAFGHGHLGLTLAAVTGRLVADLVDGAPTPIDPSPYRPDRF